MLKKMISVLLALALSVMVLAGCTTTTEKKKETPKTPFKIGAILSVTGPNAPLGDPEKKTLEMLVEAYNKAAGANGQKVELTIEDDESDPAKAVAAANKLIKQDKVSAIIGGTGTPSSMAIKPIVNQNKIPWIALAAGNAITVDANNKVEKWIFRAPAKNSVAADAALNYIEKTLKAKKIAILYDSNPFGQDGFSQIQKEAPKKGMTIVASEKYETTATDVTTQLTNIKNASPDVVIVWGTNPVPAQAAQTMKQLGMTMPYVGSHGIANKKFIELGGADADGVVFPSGKITFPESIKAGSEQRKVVDNFIKDYKAKYNNEVPNTFAGHAWDAFNILVSAMAKAGSNNEKLRSEIEKTKNFAGPDGIYNYKSTDHDGLKASDMIIIKIEGGKWTLLK